MQSGEIDFQSVFSWPLKSYLYAILSPSSLKQRNDLYQANKLQFGLIPPFNPAK